jgi:iron complex outermembrane receptor protein
MRNERYRSAARWALRCSAISLASAAFAVPAFSQTSSQTNAEAREIIVTAQRRAESVQNIPIAISVVSGDDLRKTNVTSSEEILRSLPSVEIRKAPPGASIYIRGIATQQGGGEMDPGISFSVDGVYNPFTESSSMSFYDVERIEVLKGPQGTLYGRNAIAGAVNVITKSPELGKFGGFVQAGIGNYDYVGLTGALNVPLGDTLALRVAADYQDNNGYLNLGGDDVHVYSGRAKLLWEASSKVRVELRAEYGDFDTNGNAPAIYPLRADPWTQYPTAPNVPSQTAWLAGGSMQVDVDLDFATLIYIPAYKRKKFSSATDSGNSFIRSYIYDEQHTQELRLASNQSTPLSWIIGGYYYRGINETGLNFFTTIDQHVVTTSYAVFGQTTYSVTDGVRLTGGLRYTKDKKSEDGVNTLGGRVISEIKDIKWTWENWTWRLGAEFDVGPESMLYGSVSTGFKAGGTSLVAGPRAIFDPEKLTAYEIGWKNRLLDNTLTLNLSAFYYDYSNYQAAFVAPNPDFGGAQVRRIANAGNAKIKGVEAEMSWSPTPNDLFRATVAYLDGQFGRYVVPTPNPLVFNDYSDSKVSMVPWAINASYSRDISIGADGHLVPQVSVRYNAGTWRDARQYAKAGTWGAPGTYVNPIAYQDAFAKIDANVSYSWGEDRYRISAYVKNITNKVVFTGASIGPGGGSAWLEPPRTFGASLQVSW